MGLSGSDPMPSPISLKGAYEACRAWYIENINRVDETNAGNEYKKDAKALVKMLPPSKILTELEYRAVLGEVILGNLEWAYHQSDGKYKMAAYAHAALKQGGFSFNLSEDEIGKLKASSKLWPYLTISKRH